MEKIEYVLPKDIEKRSFEIIQKELEEKNIHIPESEKAVTMRVIHATADFDFASTLKFSPDAVKKAQDLIRSGAHIVCDTNMAKAGINKKALSPFGGEVHCFMADEDVALEAKERSLTRAAVSMERAARLGKKLIFAVGNAPTALISLFQMMKDGLYVPDFVIGVPVGFVNVEAAKELFLNEGLSEGEMEDGRAPVVGKAPIVGKAVFQNGRALFAGGAPDTAVSAFSVPYIINRGRKGGSTVAAAICNAILYGMEDE